MLATLTATLTTPLAAQFSPTADAPRYRVQSVRESPRGDLSAEVLALPPGQPVDDATPLYQLWIVDRAMRSARQMLYSGNAPCEVYFSPDEFTLAVQTDTAAGSAGAKGGELLLFRHREGVHYDAVPVLDAQLWDYFAAHHPEAGAIAPETRRTQFIAWGSDSATVLVALAGEGSGARVRDWLVACDVTRSSATLDLNLINRAWPQTQNLEPDTLARQAYRADQRAQDRVAAAFHMLTQPSGGDETLPQPGDRIPAAPAGEVGSPAWSTAPTATPTPVPPAPRKLRASGDGSALLYALAEPLPPNVRRTPRKGREWFCIYDMGENRPTMDLEAINRGAVVAAAAPAVAASGGQP